MFRTWHLLSLVLTLALVFSLAGPVVVAQDDSPAPGNDTEGALFPPRTPTIDDSTISATAILPADANSLALAMDVSPADLISASLGLSDPAGVGVSNSKLSHFPTRNSTFAILSTGRASSAATANTSGSLSYVLGGLNNSQGNDLIQLTLRLRVPSDKNCMSVDFGYYSEEYPEYLGSAFNDTFTAEFGGVSLSIVGNEVVAPENFAFDSLGQIISVNTSFQVNPISSTGTTYDGGTQLLRARRAVTPGQVITVVFSVQDLGDSIYDSAVFLDNFHWLFDNNCITGGDYTNKPVLVVVHGWLGHSQWWFGRPNIQRYCGSKRYSANPDDTVLGSLPKMFSQDYDVWIVTLGTGSDYTDSIISNAWCLKNNLALIAANPTVNKRVKFIIVAHSMGGLVSRACLASVPRCKDNVDALYTLGTPNAGIADIALKSFTSFFDLMKVIGACRYDLALCEFARSRMVDFNQKHPNQPGIRYVFIGGDKTPLVAYLLRFFDGPHDGVVGKYSSVGWIWDQKITNPPEWDKASPPARFWTDEAHISDFGLAYYDYRDAPLNRVTSHAYDCIQWYQGRKASAACANAESTLAELALNTSGATQFTQGFSGTLSANQVVSYSLPIDSSGPSVFYLNWITGTVGFSLLRPDGVVITPAYASANPGEVKYSTVPASSNQLGQSIYEVANAMPGNWTLILTRNEVGGSSTKYSAFAVISSDRIFTINTDSLNYTPGQSAFVSARLVSPSGGIGGATVRANLARSDGMVDTITLNYQGDGVYEGNYIIPNVPGYMLLSATAVGQDSGVPFSRQQELYLGVGSNAAQFSNSYSAQRIDTNNDGLSEYLNVYVGLSVARAGNYSVSGDLSFQDQIVARASNLVALGPGLHSVILQFSGNDIRTAQRSGPYTLRNVQVVDTQYGSIPSQTLVNAWTTPAYNWQDFGSCHTLIKGSNPSVGGTVSASPAPNCNNGTQYAYGTVVTLTANRANGFLFANWIVDASGTTPTATVIMTDNKVVKANFVPMPKVYLPLIRR